MTLSAAVDISSLEAIAGALDYAASGGLDGDLMLAGADEGKALVLATWAEQAAPSGAPWAPRKRDYGWAPLDNTGDMKASADCYVQGLTLVFVVMDEKAIWHQFGTKRMGRQVIPARQMIFNNDETPDRWISAIEGAMQVKLDGWISTMGATT
jgi:hypothetical protein